MSSFGCAAETGAAVRATAAAVMRSIRSTTRQLRLAEGPAIPDVGTRVRPRALRAAVPRDTCCEMATRGRRLVVLVSGLAVLVVSVPSAAITASPTADQRFVTSLKA